MRETAARYAATFAEILFYRLRSSRMRQLHIVGQVFLYLLAAALFYGPIFHFVLRWCIQEREMILYAFALLLAHALAKVMLYNSKRIQQRFSSVKASKHFLVRTWLILEYVAFMWLVYLSYPLTCILIPGSLWLMFVEQLTGTQALLDLFLQNPEQFFLVGGMISYVLFIFADGYKKIRTGFLPDYLGLYAVLAAISGAVEKAGQYLAPYVGVDISNIREGLSRMFALSNDAMSMVASGMTLFFAIYSLYTSSDTQAEPEALPSEHDDDPDEAEEF